MTSSSLVAGSVGRRRFLLSGILLAAGALFVRFLPRGTKISDAALFALLCDHFLPESGTSKSARALGIDTALLQRADHELPIRIWSDTLREEFSKNSFLALPFAEQAAFLERQLHADRADNLSRALQFFLDSIALIYFTDERSFAALGYRTPQPMGFPEYAQCAHEN